MIAGLRRRGWERSRSGCETKERSSSAKATLYARGLRFSPAAHKVFSQSQVRMEALSPPHGLHIVPPPTTTPPSTALGILSSLFMRHSISSTVLINKLFYATGSHVRGAYTTMTCILLLPPPRPRTLRNLVDGSLMLSNSNGNGSAMPVSSLAALGQPREVSAGY
jgi:hypothetical protein